MKALGTLFNRFILTTLSPDFPRIGSQSALHRAGWPPASCSSSCGPEPITRCSCILRPTHLSRKRPCVTHLRLPALFHLQAERRMLFSAPCSACRCILPFPVNVNSFMEVLVPVVVILSLLWCSPDPKATLNLSVILFLFCSIVCCCYSIYSSGARRSTVYLPTK